MSWPLPSHFRTVLQTPRVAFRDPQLQSCQIERDPLGQPRPRSGGFAVVYKAMPPGKQRPVAVRTFSTESPERQQRYACVSRHLRCSDVSCLVSFEYQEDGIRSAGDGKWYPLLVMHWVNGLTLFEWVRSKCRLGKGRSLAKAAGHWLRLVEELSRAEVAHGDLQHANVMVTRQGRLKLVDYDGMGVPELWGQRNLEVGVQPYQHPRRNESTLLGPELDRFSSLLIYVALRALAADPSLWQEHVERCSYDKLLFRAEDFAHPAGSALRDALIRSPDRVVRDLTDTLFSAAVRRMQDVPCLGEIVPRQRPARPFRQKHAARPPIGRAGAGQKIPGPAKVVLDVLSGPMKGRAFVIDRHDTLLFGRGADCHARIVDDPRVSRHHFLLEAIPPSATIRDLGSRNGTVVNGVKYGGRNATEREQRSGPSTVADVDLRDGDEIVVGDTTVRFRVELPPTVLLPPRPAAVHPASEPAGTPPVELDLGDLSVHEELGRGRVGSVCKVWRSSDERPFALKIASPKISISPRNHGFVLQEFQRLQTLKQPNIVRLFGAGRLRRAYGFLMEYCNGGNLADHMKRRGGKLPASEGVMLLQQCLAGLAHAHDRDFVHGNLKPQNVLLHRGNGALVAKLADLGVARVFELTGLLGMSASVQSRIDHQLMPPERLTGFRHSDPRSDLWQLAATFYFALSGQYPRDFGTRDPIAAVLHDEPIPLQAREPSVPQPIARVIDRSLRKALADRYRTALEFREALDGAVRSGGLGLR